MAMPGTRDRSTTLRRQRRLSDQWSSPCPAPKRARPSEQESPTTTPESAEDCAPSDTKSSNNGGAPRSTTAPAKPTPATVYIVECVRFSCRPEVSPLARETRFVAGVFGERRLARRACRRLRRMEGLRRGQVEGSGSDGDGGWSYEAPDGSWVLCSVSEYGLDCGERDGEGGECETDSEEEEEEDELEVYGIRGAPRFERRTEGSLAFM